MLDGTGGFRHREAYRLAAGAVASRPGGRTCISSQPASVEAKSGERGRPRLRAARGGGGGRLVAPLSPPDPYAQTQTPSVQTQVAMPPESRRQNVVAGGVQLVRSIKMQKGKANGTGSWPWKS
jgi:hypothetical protein